MVLNMCPYELSYSTSVHTHGHTLPVPICCSCVSEIKRLHISFFLISCVFLQCSSIKKYIYVFTTINDYIIYFVFVAIVTKLEQSSRIINSNLKGPVQQCTNLFNVYLPHHEVGVYLNPM